MAAPTRFAWLSIGAALVTASLKSLAYAWTGSVGLLSDALESGVNLATAVFALFILTVAARPPDEDHAYGHSKAEYFASGAEGVLILVVSVLIGWTAIARLFTDVAPERIGLGSLVSAAAALVNGGVALVLKRAGRRYHSPTLAGESAHLMTDVWTTAGVLIGLGAVQLTGWNWLDPAAALLVGVHIFWSGLGLLRTTIDGLMDRALPADEQQAIVDVLERFCAKGVRYHDLKTRRSGATRFVSVHLEVPAEWTVGEAHALTRDLQREVEGTILGVSWIAKTEAMPPGRAD